MHSRCPIPQCFQFCSMLEALCKDKGLHNQPTQETKGSSDKSEERTTTTTTTITTTTTTSRTAMRTVARGKMNNQTPNMAVDRWPLCKTKRHKGLQEAVGK